MSTETEKGKEIREWGGFGEKEQQPTIKKDTEYMKKKCRTKLARTQTDRQWSAMCGRERQNDWL